MIGFSGTGPAPQTLAAARRRLATLVRRWGPERLAATLVVQSPNPSDEGATQEVTTAVDAWGDVHDAYGASGGALLMVRPDGYVAFHRSADDAAFAGLEAYLGQTLQPEVAE